MLISSHLMWHYAWTSQRAVLINSSNLKVLKPLAPPQVNLVGMKKLAGRQLPAEHVLAHDTTTTVPVLNMVLMPRLGVASPITRPQVKYRASLLRMNWPRNPKVWLLHRWAILGVGLLVSAPRLHCIPPMAEHCRDQYGACIIAAGLHKPRSLSSPLTFPH